MYNVCLTGYPAIEIRIFLVRPWVGFPESAWEGILR